MSLFLALSMLICSSTAVVALELPDSFPPAFGNADITEAMGKLPDRFSMLELGTMSILAENAPQESFVPTGGAVSMMTAYVALCEADLEAQVEITEELLAGSSGSMNAGLRKGDIVKVKDLIAAMIMTGARDCATVLARHISGTDEAFIQKMNAYAAQMGMSSTVYTNATGALDENQKTTIRDLLRLAVSLDSVEAGKTLFSAGIYEHDSPDSGIPRQLSNRVMLMDNTRSLYDERVRAAFGAGESSKYGFNTVIIASVNDMDVVFAISSMEEDRAVYTAVKSLLDRASETFAKKDITENIDALLGSVKYGDVELSVRTDSPVLISAEASWEPGAEDIRYILTQTAASPVLNEEFAKAQIFINDIETASLPMICTSVPPEELTEESPEETETPVQEERLRYTEMDESYEKTIFDGAGWLFWMIGGAFACGISAIVCSIVSRRLK